MLHSRWQRESKRARKSGWGAHCQPAVFHTHAIPFRFSLAQFVCPTHVSTRPPKAKTSTPETGGRARGGEKAKASWLASAFVSLRVRLRAPSCPVNVLGLFLDSYSHHAAPPFVADLVICSPIGRRAPIETASGKNNTMAITEPTVGQRQQQQQAQQQQ